MPALVLMQISLPVYADTRTEPGRNQYPRHAITNSDRFVVAEEQKEKNTQSAYRK